MDNGQDREEWRRERSLLALGRAMRGDDEHPALPRSRSLLSVDAKPGRDEERLDARARHGLARERREAAAEPELPAAVPEPVYAWPEEPYDLSPGPVAAGGAPRIDRAQAPRPRVRRWPWRLAAAMALLGACLGAAVAFSLPTSYKATAELTVGGNGTQRLAGGALDSQLRVLTSGIVLTRVVDRLNLADDPEFNGKDGGSEGFAGLLRTVLMRGDAAPDDGHRQALAVDRLAATLSVARGDDLNAIAITATTDNGEKSALIANAVADAFIEVYGQNRSGALTGPGDGAAAADDEALATAAQRRLADFAAAHDLGDPAKQPDRVAGILKLAEDLTEARARTESLNAKVTTLRSVGIDTAAAGLPREFETGAIEALRAQYLDLKQQADSAAVKLGPRNPERRGIEAQLAGARDRLSGELRRIVATQQAALKQAVETEQGLASRLAKTGLSGTDIAALRDLQREAAAAEVDRQAVTASVPANAAEGSGQGARVISRASPPSEPSGPSRTLLTFAGGMLGLFAGLGLGVLRGSAADAPEAEPDFVPADAFRTGQAGERTGSDDSAGKGRDWSDPAYPMDHSSPAVALSPLPVDAAPWPSEPPAALPLYQSSPFDSALTRASMETAMYPAYPEQPFQAAPQPQDQSRQWLQPVGHYPPQPYAPPMMQPTPPYPPQPYPPAWPQQHAYPQAWQPAPPMPSYPYALPMQAYAGQFYPPQPAFAPPMQDAGPAIDHSALDEIRASLHEFREALRELAESRSRRRIF